MNELLLAMAKVQYRDALGSGADPEWPEMLGLLALIHKYDPDYRA